MKVKLRTNMAGPTVSGSAGDVVDVPPKQAKELLDGGFAEKVPGEPEPKEVETATKDHDEESTDHPHRGKKGHHA